MCNDNNTNQSTGISTLQLIHKLRNFMYIISLQSNETATTYPQKFSPQKLYRALATRIADIRHCVSAV